MVGVRTGTPWRMSSGDANPEAACAQRLSLAALSVPRDEGSTSAAARCPVRASEARVPSPAAIAASLVRICAAQRVRTQSTSTTGGILNTLLTACRRVLTACRCRAPASGGVVTVVRRAGRAPDQHMDVAGRAGGWAQIKFGGRKSQIIHVFPTHSRVGRVAARLDHAQFHRHGA